MLSSKQRKQILHSYLETINGVSDREYQQRVWIRGEGPEVDDFDEACCNFFSGIDDILKNYNDFGISDNQLKVLKTFRDEFRVFSDENPSWPPLWIDSPEWAQIMERAKEVLSIFNYKKDSD